ncbi:ribonuclease HII, partial [Candidatus Woesearchaeota archaeon]|nr:ribonuclease HII [Candidatus Woesearchaeota archaeon]
MFVCGIDEAGRGPVIGPLVICGVLASEEQEKQLMEMGVKDSKMLTPIQRERMFEKIIKIVEKYEIVVIEPKEIDDAVNGKDSLNLNWLEAVKSAQIINKLKPH